MSGKDEERASWDLSAWNAHFDKLAYCSQFQVGLGLVDDSIKTIVPW